MDPAAIATLFYLTQPFAARIAARIVLQPKTEWRGEREGFHIQACVQSLIYKYKTLYHGSGIQPRSCEPLLSLSCSPGLASVLFCIPLK